ncbi:MAG: TRAM domain-containing protein [Nanoarchaeota archaeon]
MEGINLGDEFDVVVEVSGEKGDGICKVDDNVVFVPGVNQGEKVKIKITKLFKKVAFGEVISKEDSENQPNTSKTPSNS